MFYRSELWASKSAGAKGDVPKIYRVCTPTAPMLINAFPAIVHKVYGCRFKSWSHHIIFFFNHDFPQRKLDEIEQVKSAEFRWLIYLTNIGGC